MNTLFNACQSTNLPNKEQDQKIGGCDHQCKHVVVVGHSPGISENFVSHDVEFLKIWLLSNMGITNDCRVAPRNLR